MRPIRLSLAGTVLFGAVFLLTGLLALPPYSAVGATAVTVFLPLWLCLSLLIAARHMTPSHGIVTKEFLRRFTAAVAIPAVISLAVWVVSEAYWRGGPVITATRTPILLGCGLALWIAAAVVTPQLLSTSSAQAHRAGRASAVVFVPLWAAITVVNLLVGVFGAGYTFAEELPILVVNLSIPAAVAILSASVRPARSNAEFALVSGTPDS
ncbi:hypothetical protein AB0K81_27710 [Streptomyces werraensis]|uniref:Uncharacterized protein n=1 Tax=Streptomyces werraensis TaxID=68284 RepID=A0ABV3JMU0_9ACTN